MYLVCCLLFLLLCCCWFPYFCEGLSRSISPVTPGGIAALLSTSGPADAIYLTRGTYSGQSNCNLGIMLTGLTLVGIDGAENTIIDCTGFGRGIIVAATNVSISGLTLTNGFASATAPVRSSSSSSSSSSKNTAKSSAVTDRDINNDNNDNNDGIAHEKSLHIRSSTVSDRTGSGGCLVVAPNTVGLVLSNLTITAGYAANHGGGLAIFDSQVLLINVIVANCSSSISAGAAFFMGSDVTIVSSIFHNNSVLATLPGTGSSTPDCNSGGGALLMCSCSRVIMDSCTVASNSLSAISIDTSSLTGGGASIISSSNISISNSNFAFNVISADSSGGYASCLGAGLAVAAGCVHVRITDVTAHKNIITASSDSGAWLLGAGIAISGAFRVLVTSVIADENAVYAYNGSSRAVYGGGMYASETPSIIISSSYFVQNYLVCLNGVQYAHGGGLLVDDSSGYLVETSTFTSNSIYLTDDGNTRGSGACFSLGTNATVSNCIATDNYIFAVGNNQDSFHGGSGLAFLRCDQLHVVGITSSYNRIVTRVTGIKPNVDDWPTTNRVFDENNCYDGTVNSVRGSISTTGSSVSRSRQTVSCVWLLSPGDNIAALMSYNISLLSYDFMDYHCILDYVSVFDGPSSTSPLIGRYCGSSNHSVCRGGPCPPASNIISTGGEVSIQYHAAIGDRFSAFTLVWTMVESSTNRSGPPGSTHNNILELPATVGSGIGIFRSTLYLSDITLENNTIDSNLVAAGGGIAVVVESNAYLDHILMQYNRVSSSIAAGGGMYVSQGSSITTTKSTLVVSNEAVATGECYWAIGVGMQCPSSWGGGLLISSSDALLLELQAATNMVYCFGIRPCRVSGGGMVVTSEANVNVIKCTFVGNRCRCRDMELNYAVCQSGSGGGVFVSSGIMWMVGGQIAKCVSTRGGGLFFENIGEGYISGSVRISENTANEGGGVWVHQDSHVTIQSCEFEDNRALLVGGAVAARGNAQLSLVDIRFMNNVAVRASAIMAYLDNTKVQFEITNASIVGGVGTLVLIIGLTSINDTTYECTALGSVFERDNALGFLSMQCKLCNRGTYIIGNAVYPGDHSMECFPCLPGANCTGSNVTSEGLMAIPGYWGMPDTQTLDGKADFFLCPTGFCCPQGQEDCPYYYCSGGRTGELCGKCPEGTGLQFFSSACRPDAECHAASWAFVVLLLITVVFITLMVVISQRPADGAFSVLIFFYQAVPLVVRSGWVNSTIGVLEAVFGLTPTEGQGPTGICIVPGMTQSQKLGWVLLIPCILNAGCVAAVPIHQYLERSKWVKRLVYRNRQVSVAAVYFGVLTKVFLISYTTLAVTTLQMFHCFTFNGERRWWFDASIPCLRPWQQVSAVAFTALSCIPLALGVLLWKWKDGAGLGKKMSEIRRVLVEPYKTEREWFAAMAFFRRLLLAIIFAEIEDSAWKSIATSVLCTLFLAMQLWLKPYYRAKVQRLEVFSLTILCMLAATTAPELAQEQFGSAAGLSGQTSLRKVQLALVILPAIIWATQLTMININRARKRMLRWRRQKVLIVEEDGSASSLLC